jgi:hypothetical protein
MIRLPLLVLLQLAIGVTGPLPTPTAPPGLAIELRTVANRTTFRLSELVPLEVVFRPTKDDTFSIEIADDWNRAPAADRFLIEPRQSVIDRNVWWVTGIPPSSRRGLRARRWADNEAKFGLESGQRADQPHRA